VNSAAGSFGLSFGLAFAGAIMLAMLSASFTSLSAQSEVLTAEEQQRVAAVLEEDAQLVSNTALTELLDDASPAVAEEIVRINTQARPLALQIALLVPILSAGIGIVNGLRMRRLPDPRASEGAEGMLLG